MAAMLGDDDFDQFDKPGAERSRRRRPTDDDWDSEMEDDLLEEDYLPGKKASPDLSDEELNDDLLQSDEEEQNPADYSAQGVTVSLNATTGGMSSFDLSRSIKEEQEESPAVEGDLQDPENEEMYEEVEDLEAGADDFVESYEDNYEVPDEQIEYQDEVTTDGVLDLEITEPLDEFQEEEVSQAYKRQKVSKEQYVEDVGEEAEDAPEEAEQQDPANTTEEGLIDFQELPPDIKEESDDEDEEEDEGRRIRFKTERKEGTIIRLSDTNRERRNIPDTLELSAEAKASLMEFEEMERQRKSGRYGPRRGGRRGGNNAMHRGVIDQRHNQNDRRNLREQRSNQGQPIRTLFQQQQQRIQPLLPMQRPQHDGSQMQQEKTRAQATPLSTPPHQSKNIHINPHFKGNVTSVQVPLLSVPNQPRPAVGPPRFPGLPDFPHVSGSGPVNFNPPPRLQEPWRNTPPPPPPPPPQPEREQFFIGEPRFPNHHMFDQRNPPPSMPPPPLLNSNLPGPNQNPPPFSPPGQGFNQPGPQQRFSQPQSNFNPPGPGQQAGFNPPGPQAGFTQPRFNQPGPQPGFSQSGPQPNFNPPGPQSGFNPPGQPGFQPNFNQSGPPPGFNQSAPQVPFNPPGMNQPGFNQQNPGPQPGFNQPGTGPQSNFPQPVPGPQQGFNNPGFTRERPVRINLPPPGPMGIPPFSQQSTNIRHFPPPRQQFSPGPGQPFMPHNQSNMQRPMQPPLQTLHQHHQQGGQQKPPMPMPQTAPFRAHSQNPSHRMPGPRHPALKQRQSTPLQHMMKAHSQQVAHARNSNLRELPIAPSHSVDMNKRKATSAPAAHVIPVATTAPQPRSVSAESAQAAKPGDTTSTIKADVKVEEQFPDEDEETRKYRLKIEEQKRLREEILKQKELRRQQQAGARKKELLQRLTQQQPPQQASSAQESQLDTDKQTVKSENNSSQILPQVTSQVRPNVKNRLLSKRSEALTTSPQKIPHLQTAVPNVTFQGQQKKVIKQTMQNKVLECPASKVQQVRPGMSAPSLASQHAVKVVPVEGKPPEQRLAGTKRTVMQRSNSSSGEGAHIAPKVRVIKLSTGAENNALEPAEGGHQPQVPQQRIPSQQRIVSQQRLPMQQQLRPQMQQQLRPQMQQQLRPQMQQQLRPQMQQQLRPQMQQRLQMPQQQMQQQQRPQMQQRPLMQQQRPQQRTGPVRKVTLGKASVQQQQQSQQQQFQVKPHPQLSGSTGSQIVTSVQGYRPANKVIMRGRGRGVGGQMGRGHPMPNKQNLRMAECTPQTCVVSVEGLSSSTTDNQLKNLLMSVGPIEDLQMFPHQRKAIATFENQHHALQFQQRFHRHMIDLSHINVSMVAE
ncbi:PREDICTED: RNA-binding protein 33 [Nanorana parkeri]|uniref:RNA-binding protein 33 n=1 Tax=Nanorana parkeri TaxID=125878 RepID=UPI00085509DB|nr:PREDICTED: RNA-binding protein 33 [Nanorana parkeri]